METRKIIGNNIKNYRIKLGFSQDHIANYLGIDRTAISKYENGEREISLVNLNKLADLFGIELDYLLEPKTVDKTANLAFAFRKQGLEQQDIRSIAEFQKVVKNYMKILQIKDEKK